MLRKTLLAVIAIFVANGSIKKLIFGAFVSIIFLVLHVRWLPMREDSENKLQAVSLSCTAIILLLGCILQAQPDDSSTQIITVVVGVLPLGFMVYIIIYFTIPGFASIFTVLPGLSNEKKTVVKASVAKDYATVQMCDVGVSKQVDDEGSGVGTAERRDSDTSIPESSALLKADSQAGYEEVRVEDIVDELFERYDLDSSGTLNSHEELGMLATNVAFKLKETQDPSIMRLINDKVSMIDADAVWDQTRFIQWFKAEIMTAVSFASGEASGVSHRRASTVDNGHKA